MLRRLQSLLPVLLALLPWAWILAPLLLHNQFYVSENAETLQLQYPLHHLLGLALQEGRLPLWTPLLSNGFPLLAEGESGGMYPLNLFLFKYLAPYNAYQMAIALAPLISLIAGYYYLIYRKHSPWAALLGSGCYAFGGYFLGHLRHLDHLQAMSMLPMTLLFAERYLDRRLLFDALMTAAALSVALLAGVAQVPYLIGLALVVLLLVRAWEKPDPTLHIGVPLRGLDKPGLRVVQAFLLLPGAALLAGLLAAPQLLLTWDLLPFTDRLAGQPIDPTGHDALGLPELLHFLDPHAHGIPAAGTYTLEGHYWETLGYVGLLPLVLSLVALLLVLRRDRRVVFPLVLTATSLTLAFGASSPLYRLFWQIVPGFSAFQAPGRFVMLATLGLGMLAALGLDMLLERLEQHPHAVGRAFAGLLPLLILAVTGVDLGYHGAALLAWMDKEGVLEPPPTKAAMPNLGPFHLLSLPGGARREGQPDGRAPRDLRRDPQPFLDRRSLLWRDFNAVHQVNAVGADLALPFAGYRRLEDKMIAGIQPDGKGGLTVSEGAFNLMNFLGVRMVMSYFSVTGGKFLALEDVPVPGLSTPVKRYGIDDPYPRAYLARQLKTCGPEVALERIVAGHFGSGWEPCQAGKDREGSELEESQGVAGYAQPSVRGDVYVEYKVNLLRPGYLVVRESYAPGWIAIVDGQEAPLIPVDFIYRATPVPKGKHEVRYEYRPRGMSTGLGLNMMGLILIGIGLMLPKLRAQRFDLAPPPEDAPRPPPQKGEDGWFH